MKRALYTGGSSAPTDVGIELSNIASDIAANRARASLWRNLFVPSGSPSLPDRSYLITSANPRNARPG